MKFDSSRYPGFAFKRTGRYACHWEAAVDDSVLREVRAKAARDGYDVKAVPLEYTRSSGYREAFLEARPGPYRCRYCNRRIEARDMTVDHLVPVAMAGRSRTARGLLTVMGAHGVNDMANLVEACPRCNGRKADKGGLWIARGLLGRYPAYWIAVYACCTVFALAVAAAMLHVLHDPGEAVRRAVATIGIVQETAAQLALGIFAAGQG